MITDFILGIVFFLTGAMIDTLPEQQGPTFISQATNFAATVFGYAGSMGVWFPTGLALTVLTALFVTWGVSFVLKIGRILISHFTGGGGGAA